MKAAVYFGSHHIYDDMLTSAKSLLANSDVDKIYFLIEDNEFPYPLPDCIEVRNIRFVVPKIFDQNNPNYNTRWTYIGLIRAALTKVFPELDIVLSIDCDAIVDKDISDLWMLPMDSYYIAAAKEPVLTSVRHMLYTNSGVTLFNLKKMREDNIDNEMIYALNMRKYTFVAQDVLNLFCQNHILEISSDYNACDYTNRTNNPKVIHYAGKSDWREDEVVKKYREMPWNEVRSGLCVT